MRYLLRVHNANNNITMAKAQQNLFYPIKASVYGKSTPTRFTCAAYLKIRPIINLRRLRIIMVCKLFRNSIGTCEWWHHLYANFVCILN